MNKNKKIIIGILIAVLIVISVVVTYKLVEKSVTDRENFKYSINNISSTPVDTVNYEKNHTKVIDNTKLNITEEEIKNAIIEHLVKNGDNEYKHYENEKTFVSMKIYLIEEKEKQMLYNIYAWVLEEKYYLENNEMIQDSGSSMPYKFVVENIDGKIIVKDTQIPRDGSYYAEDMKSIFPSSVNNDMDRIQIDGTMESLQLDIKRQTELYFK